MGILFLETGDFFVLEPLDLAHTFFLETLALGADLAATLEFFLVDTTFFLKTEDEEMCGTLPLERTEAVDSTRVRDSDTE